jgi:Domain of unknown function (DUF4184)
MPFTPSHAVVALPFLRTPLTPAAIAIGAMTPDLPLFFPVLLDYDMTHSFPGMFVVGIPVSLVLLISWRMLLRPAVSELSPRWIRDRTPADWNASPASGWWHLWGGSLATPRHRGRATVLLVASLALGLATHVAWDAFTHHDRWGSAVVPALAMQWGALPGYQWLQHGSSAFGLIVLSIWGVRWMRQQHPTSVAPRSPGWLRLGVWWAVPACLVAAVLVDMSVHGEPTVATLRNLLFRAGTLAGAAIILTVAVAAPIALVYRRSRR